VSSTTIYRIASKIGKKKMKRARQSLHAKREHNMSNLLLIILLLLVIGGLPNWGYHNLGYGPSGFGGVALIVVVVLLLTGRL